MVAAVLLTLSGPAVAGAVAYEWLNQEWWTSTGAGTAAAPTRPDAGPVPAPSPQAAPTPPRASRHPWPAGSCVTAAADRTPCSSPGALRVVASLHAPKSADPCHDAPETTLVRRAGAYTLCLATL
ncbi:hypothetical protein ACFWGV_21870, partial [Bacillus subtilis]